MHASSLSVFRASAAVAALALAGGASMAQVPAGLPPTGGLLLQEAQPRPQPPRPGAASGLQVPPAPAPALAPEAAFRLPEGRSVQVARVALSGLEPFDAAPLEALSAAVVGQRMDFGAMQALAQRLTAATRAQGFPFARAYLPAQALRDGVLEVALQPGRLGRVVVQPDAALGADADALRRRLPSLREGEPLRADALERDLLLLSEWPGVRLQSVLRPGEAPGTTDLEVVVLPGQRVAVQAGLDNFGNRFSSRARLSAGLTLASPLRIGDALDVSVLGGDAGYRYARVAWQAGVGVHGTRAGVSVADLRYRLGGPFASLDAHGTARDLGLQATHPLLRTRAASLDLNLSLSRRDFEDTAQDLSRRKRAQSLTVALAGSRALDDGMLGGSAELTAGRLRLAADASAADALGLRTAGGYAKLGLRLRLDRQLAADTTLQLRATGQAALRRNLDASEQASLGGVGAVRAYAQGEAPSDHALLLAVDLRHALSPNWAVRVFADAAQGRAHRAAPAGAAPGTRTLSGVGLGVDFTLPGRASVQATLARRTGALPQHGDDAWQFWWQAALKF